jgi:hypothetical protein
VTEKVGPESKMQEKPLVLILCTGNSCRSHLAEGILRQKAGELIRAHFETDRICSSVSDPRYVFSLFSPGARRNRESMRRLRSRYKPGNATVSMSVAGGVIYD